jgi:hypothetical protein
MTTLETLNMKIAVSKLSSLLVTHMAYSDARFDSYGILNSIQGAENFLDRSVMQMNDQVFGPQDE